jgi:antirestriction protein ArdC
MKTFEQASSVGNSAFYAPGRDLVQMPSFEAFRDKEGSYATALHITTSEVYQALVRGSRRLRRHTRLFAPRNG